MVSGCVNVKSPVPVAECDCMTGACWYPPCDTAVSPKAISPQTSLMELLGGGDVRMVKRKILHLRDCQTYNLMLMH